ncbi:MAG TPA: VWA domain-containing protein [Chitinophagaceae bacterium]|nr:VWA domain-containing protein [Chitinophagaceae bacterium]
MKQQAFQTSSIAESVVAFGQFARSHGLNVGIQETQDALNCLNEGLICDRKWFKNALKAIFCNSPEERKVFEKLFLLYWDTNPMDLQEPKNKTSVQGAFNKKANASLVMLGRGKTEATEEEGKSVSGANETERLKRTDISRLSEMDAGLLEEIAKKMYRQMALRLRRRLKEARSNGQINLRRTIRRSIGYGGEPIELFRRAQKPKKQRLIVLLDVSGSMDKYSYFLLRFIYALRENFRQLEAFVFSTSLIRISKALQSNRLDVVLTQISRQVDNWSSGTRIGECLGEFNEKYGKLLLNGSPTILILSDGLDTGDPALLGREMIKLHRRSKRLIWMNPLKGMKGYAPEAKGMKAALPVIDDFRSAHNLNSLLELENILADA